MSAIRDTFNDKSTILHVGIDVGSTTVKLVVADELGNMLHSVYIRHQSEVWNCVVKCVKELKNLPFFSPAQNATIAIAGSGGMDIASIADIPFIQEVVACAKAVETFIPQTDVSIELGGEDAKITFFTNGVEQRMNGTCAGGTGAFIDQMAMLLKTDASGLNELAKGASNIYPIAARCGVFAKTDVQPLLNEGVNKNDIALSIFQAVANQTIGGLSCGRKIRGNAVFLGGPLNFLSELKNRFIEILELPKENIIEPKHSELFVALGATLFRQKTLEMGKIVDIFENLSRNPISSINTLRPLFIDENEREEFKKRHEKAKAARADLNSYKGETFLGLDCGSTTTKAVLLSKNSEILYEFYASNEGDPLKVVKQLLEELYAKLPNDVKIAKSCVTGYGETLIKEAYEIDISEVETIAHYKAALFFMKNVDCIVDIGGQDMKYVRIKNGVIDNILLNEACSSGCGSFIETFAHSLGMGIEQFGKAALSSNAPCDLGSRCTVFMNSSVKQAQKEGLRAADISAGLSYAVIKNALIKVIKLKNPENLGEHIIVQGGTFYNDSVLRAFEIISGREVVRPEISGLMGAFGAALLARENFKGEISTTINQESLKNFSVTQTMLRCHACSNSCAMTLNKFSDGRKLITGNRCERGAGKVKTNTSLPNLYEYKYKKLFAYKSGEFAPLGTIGIPRVLNMYENYPLWFTFLTNLGFEVILSDESSKALVEKGLDTLPSDTVCYPAKLVHGHIVNLIEKGVKAIFYPCVSYEKKEFEDAHEHYNCPIVISYPEQIRNNIEILKEKNIKYIQPFLSLENREKLASRLIEVFKEYNLSRNTVKNALYAAWEEQNEFKKDLAKKGEETLEFLKESGKHGIVLSGRPYHLDPEIHHGIPQVITSLGMSVLTEDSISHISGVENTLRVVDQWTYHSRLYRAADLVANSDFLDLIQLNSFGCGLDSVTTDQVQELLEHKNKIYTCVKIDEVNNIGAVKIRIRSLKAALLEREKNAGLSKTFSQNKEPKYKKLMFTKKMKDEGYTIIAPQMSPIHFQFLESAFKACGYNFKLLEKVGSNSIDEGLRYVNNDACYPSIIVVGQVIEELKKGDYDLNKTAVMMSQTGGGCRATNYIAYLRKALHDAGFPQIPVISFNTLGLEQHDGFKLSLPLLNRLLMGCVYGDILMQTTFQTRPYEKVKGSANALFEKWSAICNEAFKDAKFSVFKNNIEGIIKDFDALPLFDIKKPRVGLVGEILVKYHPTANNDIVDILEKEGCEAVQPGLMEFLLYCAYDYDFNHKYLSKGAFAALAGKAAIHAMEFYRKHARKILKQSKRFSEPAKIDELAFGAAPILSRGNQTGEGWFLTAEMIHLIHDGVPNIICMQPFACLPNHIVGKGVMKALKENYPEANIAAIDYDPGSSAVNQLNRIKLMLSAAFKNLEHQTQNKEEFSETAV